MGSHQDGARVRATNQSAPPPAFFGTFRGHAGACAACRGVELDKTATWAHACMAGVAMLKNAAEATSRDIRKRAARDARFDV